MDASNDVKVAIVTGAGKGIGRAIALELSRVGYYIAVNFRTSREAAEETIKLIEKNGGQGEAQAFDVTDAGETKAALDDLFSRYKAIDVLVNNAGVARVRRSTTCIGAFNIEGQYVNLTGFFNVTKPVLRKMARPIPLPAPVTMATSTSLDASITISFCNLIHPYACLIRYGG